MEPRYVDELGSFTEGEAMMGLGLFTSLAERGLAPICIFALNREAVPCAMFNAAFSQADADSMGDVIVQQLEVIQENAPS